MAFARSLFDVIREEEEEKQRTFAIRAQAAAARAWAGLARRPLAWCAP